MTNRDLHWVFSPLSLTMINWYYCISPCVKIYVWICIQQEPIGCDYPVSSALISWPLCSAGSLEYTVECWSYPDISGINRIWRPIYYKMPPIVEKSNVLNIDFRLLTEPFTSLYMKPSTTIIIFMTLSSVYVMMAQCKISYIKSFNYSLACHRISLSWLWSRNDTFSTVLS